MYATTSEVAARLGRGLTAQETTSYGSILEAVSDEINTLLDLTDDLAVAPAALKGVTVTAAIRAAANPEGVASRSETLGRYQHSETFPRSSDSATLLTGSEIRLLRKAFYGSTINAPRVGSVLDDIYPTVE